MLRLSLPPLFGAKFSPGCWMHRPQNVKRLWGRSICISKVKLRNGVEGCSYGNWTVGISLGSHHRYLRSITEAALHGSFEQEPCTSHQKHSFFPQRLARRCPPPAHNLHCYFARLKNRTEAETIAAAYSSFSVASAYGVFGLLE